MDYDKSYILKCDKNIDEDTKRILLNCNIKGKEVIVDHAKELGIIFKKLDEVGINVIDLEIKQRSLYDFFKQEGGE